LTALDIAIEVKIGNIRRANAHVEKEFNKLHPEIPDDIYLPEDVDEFDSKTP
jgi:hypothetical protein